MKIKETEYVAIIGSGGKTSLLYYLSNVFRKQRVLVGPTTKMGFPINQLYDRLFLDDYPLTKQGQSGISFIGDFYSECKLASAPLEVLSTVLPYYDKVFLECDGSKQLPLKGWAEFEPVILPETTLTIGIIPIKSVGLKVSQASVHRLSLFSQLTGKKVGEMINEDTLAAIINEPAGIWAKSCGQRCLFFNQVETATELEQVRTVISYLKSETLALIDVIVAGSVKNEVGEVLWEKKR